MIRIIFEENHNFKKEARSIIKKIDSKSGSLEEYGEEGYFASTILSYEEFLDRITSLGFKSTDSPTEDSYTDGTYVVEYYDENKYDDVEEDEAEKGIVIYKGDYDVTSDNNSSQSSKRFMDLNDISKLVNISMKEVGKPEKEKFGSTRTQKYNIEIRDLGINLVVNWLKNRDGLDNISVIKAPEDFIRNHNNYKYPNSYFSYYFFNDLYRYIEDKINN